MARTVADQKLESRTVRDKLKGQRKPYYRAIEEGFHLGYRKPMSSGVAKQWVLRSYSTEKRSYAVRSDRHRRRLFRSGWRSDHKLSASSTISTKDIHPALPS